MANISKTQGIVIGVFYQRSNDPMDIVRSNAGDQQFLYGFDAHHKPFQANKETVASWTQLCVSDFPNSSDPKLPYVFDLHWDIKRISNLEWVPSGERKEVAALLVEHYGVQDPFNHVEELANVVRKRNDIENGYTQAPASDADTPGMGH